MQHSVVGVTLGGAGSDQQRGGLKARRAVPYPVPVRGGLSQLCCHTSPQGTQGWILLHDVNGVCGGCRADPAMQRHMEKASSGPSGLALTRCALGVLSHTGVIPRQPGREMLAEHAAFKDRIIE